MTLDEEVFKGPDAKPVKRVKNPSAMANVHAKGCFCVLNCNRQGEAHHVIFKSQGGDDDQSNLCCLCPDHHRLIHAEDQPTLVLLVEYLLLERPNVISYIYDKLGEEGADEWLKRRLLISR